MKDEDNCEISIKRILVPTDGSGQAFKALGQAIDLARVCEAELTLLMVVNLNENVSAFERVSISGQVPAELKIGAFQFLAELMHVIPIEIRAHTRVEMGDPAELITYVAEEEESDLIVMGCRSMSTLKTFFTGTVSQYVMKHAYCPVLLCKGMPDDWDEEDLED